MTLNPSRMPARKQLREGYQLVKIEEGLIVATLGIIRDEYKQNEIDPNYLPLFLSLGELAVDAYIGFSYACPEHTLIYYDPHNWVSREIQNYQQEVYSLMKGANIRPKVISASKNSPMVAELLQQIQTIYGIIQDEQYGLMGLTLGKILPSHLERDNLHGALIDKQLSLDMSTLLQYRFDGFMHTAYSATKAIFGQQTYNQVYYTLLEQIGIRPLQLFVGGDSESDITIEHFQLVVNPFFTQAFFFTEEVLQSVLRGAMRYHDVFVNKPQYDNQCIIKLGETASTANIAKILHHRYAGVSHGQIGSSIY